MCAAPRKAFKDYFDGAAARALAAQVTRVLPGFERAKFTRLATSGLSELEFAARVQKFADALAATLPSEVPVALAVLTESLPEPLERADEVTDGWLQWPVGQFIADHGVPHFEASMEAMVALTKRFSAEFAVRPFVAQRPKETFERLLALTRDANPHVRRWCSEGTRPRLPWGVRLTSLVKDPTPIWPILEALVDDPELYVRRSVANNLNDIAKDHPALVVNRCRAWSRDGDARRDWIVKHALRGLVKAGDRGALAAVGYSRPVKLTAELRVRPTQISVGGEVVLEAELRSGAARAQDLLVDYAVYYVRQRGEASRKVFKWTTARLPARGTRALEKRHPMRRTTIRALYPGRHRVELQVNGVRVAAANFRLR